MALEDNLKRQLSFLGWQSGLERNSVNSILETISELDNIYIVEITHKPLIVRVDYREHQDIYKLFNDKEIRFMNDAVSKIACIMIDHYERLPENYPWGRNILHINPKPEKKEIVTYESTNSKESWINYYSECHVI